MTKLWLLLLVLACLILIDGSICFVLAEKEQQFHHWPLVSGSLGLDGDGPNKSISSWVNCGYPGHWPLLGKGMILLDEDNVSYL